MTSDVAWIFMISLRVPLESLRHLRPTRLGCGQGKVGCRHVFSHQSRSMILRQGNAQARQGLKVLGCIGWWFNRFYKWCFKTLLKYQTDGYLWSNTIQYPRLSATPLQTQGWQMANCTHLCHKLQKPTKLSSVQRMMHFRCQSHFGATVRASDFHTFWSFRCLCIILEPFKWKSSTQQFLTLPSSSSPSLHSLPHPGPGASLGNNHQNYLQDGARQL